jgi:hypothetical protein
MDRHGTHVNKLLYIGLSARCQQVFVALTRLIERQMHHGVTAGEGAHQTGSICEVTRHHFTAKSRDSRSLAEVSHECAIRYLVM